MTTRPRPWLGKKHRPDSFEELELKPLAADRPLGALVLLGPIAAGPRQEIRVGWDSLHGSLVRSVNGGRLRRTTVNELGDLVKRELKRVLKGG